MGHTVSVVILTTKNPVKVLECLENQTFQNFEIIIADKPGIVQAMNDALKRAGGEIFVRVDDDVIMPDNWLEELIRPFERSVVGGVTGPTFVLPERRQNRDSIRWAEKPHPFLKWLYDDGEFNPAGIRKCGVVSYDSNFLERFKGYETLRICDHLEGTNWAMRTNLIREVEGFDPKFDGVAEWFDTDVEFKIKNLGYGLVYNPNAFIYHILEKGDHFNDRFEGFGRIKNFLRFHWRHARWRFLNFKFYVFLITWGAYFVWKKFR